MTSKQETRLGFSGRIHLKWQLERKVSLQVQRKRLSFSIEFHIGAEKKFKDDRRRFWRRPR